MVKSCRTHTHLFQKLPNLAPAPKSQNAPVLHRFTFVFCALFLATVTRHQIFSIAYVYQGLEQCCPEREYGHWCHLWQWLWYFSNGVADESARGCVYAKDIQNDALENITKPRFYKYSFMQKSIETEADIEF